MRTSRRWVSYNSKSGLFLSQPSALFTIPGYFPRFIIWDPHVPDLTQVQKHSEEGKGDLCQSYLSFYFSLSVSLPQLCPSPITLKQVDLTGLLASTSVPIQPLFIGQPEWFFLQHQLMFNWYTSRQDWVYLLSYLSHTLLSKFHWV